MVASIGPRREDRPFTAGAMCILPSRESKVASRTSSLVPRGRWCCERQACEEAQNGIMHFICRHGRTLWRLEPLSVLTPQTLCQERAGSAQALAKRVWADANGFTTAASRGPETFDTDEQEDFAKGGRQRRQGGLDATLELVACRLLKRRGEEARARRYRCPGGQHT